VRVAWNKGLRGEYHLSKKTRQKMSDSHKGLCSGRKHPMFGQHHSEESRLKMSCSLKGLFAGERHPMFGKHHSEETREKISKIRRRQHWSPEVKRKISESHIGEKNPSWKGGISFLQYPKEFDESLKQSIRERDGNKCQNPNCGQENLNLDVHHIDYNKENCHPINLISLCRSCNPKANTNRQKWQQLYQEIVLRRTTDHFIRMAA
jgi:hypothetical protein